MPNRAALAGKNFGRFSVIEYAYTRNGTSYWHCVCSCGAKKIVRGKELISGRTKSCGCYKTEFLKKQTGNRFKKGNQSPYSFKKGIQYSFLFKEGNTPKNKLSDKEAGINKLYGSYKSRANKRGMAFEITKEEFESLTLQPCFYCGVEPLQKCKRRAKNYTDGYYVYNGIDRIDSSKGYIQENVVSCCGDCNRAKSIKTQEDFLSWVKRIYEYSFT